MVFLGGLLPALAKFTDRVLARSFCNRLCTHTMNGMVLVRTAMTESSNIDRFTHVVYIKLHTCTCISHQILLLLTLLATGGRLLTLLATLLATGGSLPAPRYWHSAESYSWTQRFITAGHTSTSVRTAPWNSSYLHQHLILATDYIIHVHMYMYLPFSNGLQ